MAARKRKTMLWDRARAALQKVNNRKGKHQRRRFSSGKELMKRNISLWGGYMLKWTIKTSLLCLRFGVLFVGNMRIKYVGSKLFC